MTRNGMADSPKSLRGVPPEVMDPTLLAGRRIILYGAGKIGRRVHRALKWFGQPVFCIWDRRAEVIAGEWDGIPLRAPELDVIPHEQRMACVVIVTIFSENVANQIREELQRAGYAYVIAERPIINELLHAECASRQEARQFTFDLKTCQMCPVVSDSRSRCDMFDRYVREHFVHGMPDAIQDELVIPSLGVLVSNKCTLTCEGCNHLRDHYVSSDNVDVAANRILADVSRLLDAVDLVNKLVLVGGEALLHPDIETILEGVLRLPRVGIVQMITNGTVVPKRERVFQMLASPRVIVEVSDYGPHVPDQLRRNIERFVSRLEAHGVHYRRTSTLQWFDFGGFEDREYSAEQVRKVYDTCCFVSNDLFDGRLYKCSRSAYGTLIGKVPDYQDDYVGVREGDRLTIRKQIAAFLALPYAKVCRHCNGASTNTIEAGRQVIAVSAIGRSPHKPEPAGAVTSAPAALAGRIES